MIENDDLKPEDPKPLLLVAMPAHGQICSETFLSVVNLVRAASYFELAPIDRVMLQISTKDVVRVRNRFVHHFLHKTKATHLLFVDSDVEFTPQCIVGMFLANRAFVSAPYPLRGEIDWGAVRKGAADSTVPLEAWAYKYPNRHEAESIEPTDVGPDGCLETSGVPLGCALLRRRELQQVYDACTTRYNDYNRHTGQSPLVANLFGLLLRDRLDGEGEGAYGGLLSEDYSFCERWKRSGQKIHLYLGDGSPINHVGPVVHHGHIEAFGLARAKAEAAE